MAPPRVIAFSRALRLHSTDAEQRLWALLRARRIIVKFRRQYALGPYVLDFYCPSHRLAVEADGGQHFTTEGLAHDCERDEYLRVRGVRVIRFTDRDILLEPTRVQEAIAAVLAKR